MSQAKIPRYLIRLLLFLLLPAGAWVWLEIRVAHIPNSYNTKRTYFEKSMGNVETLILGPSHALFGVNPADLRGVVFNLSQINQSVYYDQALLLKYLDRMPHLQQILWCIPSTSLWQSLDLTPDYWRDYFYFHFWDLNSPYISWKSPMRYSYVALYGTDKVLEYLGKGLRVNLSDTIDEHGWLHAHGNSDSLGEGPGRRHAALHSTYFAHEAAYRDNRRRLHEMLELCRSKKIRMILFECPLLPYYKDHLNPKMIAQTRQVLEEMSRQYHIPYLDYSSDSVFHAADFYDDDHLNVGGANKFTPLLQQGIDQAEEDGY